MIENLILAAFFAYGMFTIQRQGFILDFLTKFWKKFPKSLHEPLYSCGICVSSIWGTFYIVVNRILESYEGPNVLLFRIPLYVIMSCGVTVIFDRAVKYFEYGYRYNPIKPMSDYTYLRRSYFREAFTNTLLDRVIADGVNVIEIGGRSESIAARFGNLYNNYDKYAGISDVHVPCSIFGEKYFVIVHGIAYEGDFNNLMALLINSQGFLIEGSMSGVSGKQLEWVKDQFSDLVKVPFTSQFNSEKSPEHCGGNVNDRVFLIKEYLGEK